jgi:hypothetical protein
MNEEPRKSYTIRLPAQIAARLEACASAAGTAPTTLIQLLIIRRFESDADSVKDPPPAKAQQSQFQASARSEGGYEPRQEQRHR